jgi:hypothetical protein
VNLEAATLAQMLLDTRILAEIAKTTPTRSTIDARTLGDTAGAYTGVVAVATRVCRAHEHRVTRCVSDAAQELQTRSHGGLLSMETQTAILADLAADLQALAERETCGDTVLWRDEDVAMARRDLAPYLCRRTAGHDGKCAMHPRAAAVLDAGQVPTNEDWLAPVPA